MNAQSLLVSALRPPTATLVVSTALFHSKLEAQGITVGEVMVACALMLTHRGMVGAKYAMLSHREYERLMDSPDDETALRWQMELQLVTGWLSPAPYIVNSELRLAAEYSDISLSSTRFLIDPVASKERLASLTSVADTMTRLKKKIFRPA